MSTSVHLLFQTQPVHSLQMQPTVVRFNFLNGCDDLDHLVIYDYATWSRSEGDEEELELFSLDSFTDYMYASDAHFPLAPNNLYLVRAYFLGRGEIEMIFTLANQGNPTLNLQIIEYREGPAFAANNTFKDLTRDDADLLLINAMHI